jgi:hypothetical protein
MRSLQNEISRLRMNDSVGQIETLRAKNEEFQTELEGERQRREQAEKVLTQLNDKEKPVQTPTPNNEQQQLIIATVFLKPCLVREGETTAQITLNSNTRTVHLQPILLQDDYPIYTANLSTIEGKSIFNSKSLIARKTKNGSILFLKISAGSLTAGDYILKVRGTTNESQVEDVASYYFRVRR